MNVRVMREVYAARVIFFYPGEVGTYVDHADVVLYENGIVHLKTTNEETSTHLQNCEILWQLNLEEDRPQNKVRLLRVPQHGMEAEVPEMD